MTDPFAFPGLLPVARPPHLDADCALFLDLDGTLLDIAATPGSVIIPKGLVQDLARTSVKLGGALAVVSGRPLDEVDRLLAPLRLPGAGEHGCVIRMPSGVIEETGESVPMQWHAELKAATSKLKGTFIERKTRSVAVHYRLAPQHESMVRRACNALVANGTGSFEVLQGKMVVEIRPVAANKGVAVRRLMEAEPFRGRRPIFVGDDVTDIDGFRAAQALGGTGADVFMQFAGRPAEVRHWVRMAPAN